MGTTVQKRTTTLQPHHKPDAGHDVGERGTLTLSKRVVEKIASQAAREISAIGGTTGGFLGIGSHASLSNRPSVDVDLSGRTATIQVDVAIAYPSPIAEGAEQVRTHMMSRVKELAGVTVSRVDVRIIAVARHHQNKDVLR